MGVVSPNGIGNEAFCRAVLAGTSGVRRVSSFDPADLPVQIAGEVQGFDELAWVDVPDSAPFHHEAVGARKRSALFHRRHLKFRTRRGGRLAENGTRRYGCEE